MAGWGGAFSRKKRAQLRAPADVCDWRHGRAAGAAAAAARSPPSPATPRPRRSPPGAKIFSTYCVRCHGGATILPDLRRSTPGIYAGLDKILDGSLVERGMPRFAELDKPAIAALRAYLLDERRKLAQAQ